MKILSPTQIQEVNGGIFHEAPSINGIHLKTELPLRYFSELAHVDPESFNINDFIKAAIRGGFDPRFSSFHSDEPTLTVEVFYYELN